MKKLRNVFQYLMPYWIYALLNILFNILSVLFSLASFALFIPVLQILFKTTQARQITDELNWLNINSLTDHFYYQISLLIEARGQTQILLLSSILIIVLYLLRNLFKYLAMFYLAPIRNGVVKDLRNKLFYKVLILPLSYFTNKKKGDIISRITSDVQEVEWSIMSSLEMIFRDPIAIISYLIALVIINPTLTLFVLILLPLSAFVIGKIGKSLKSTSLKGQQQLGEMLSTIEETISGLRIIKAFNAIEQSNSNFQKENLRYSNLMIGMYRKRDLASPLSEFLSVIVLVAVLWFGGQLVLSEKYSLDAAVFITYLGIFSQIIPPSKAITTAYYNLQKGNAALDRIYEVLGADEVVYEKPEAISKSDFKKEIRFQNVSFAYEKKNVLNNINCTIRKGKTTAIVGASGSGKSTFVDLIARFFDCKEGELTVDNIPIQDLKIDDLRALSSIVSQDTILFNDSVFNNIALGIDNVSKLDVIKAAKVANAHDFIMEMTDDYNSNIGDRGIKLSGGQRQRISIARAVLKNAPILILDEATSELDTESEVLIKEALDNLMKDKTCIIIAHQISSIQFADEILVFERGQIKEKGAHNELIALDGLYNKLYNLQTTI